MDLINVGIMERDNDSILKPVRGKKLPLKLSETSSAGETKVLAIDKHASNNQSFCGLEDYVYCTLIKKKWFTPRNTNWYRREKGKTIHIM